MALLGAAGNAAAQPRRSPPPAQGGDITVMNSPNAITGRNVNINIYEQARQDPITQEFVSTLRMHNRALITMLQQPQPVPQYVFVIDDPAMSQAVPNGPSKLYVINIDAQALRPGVLYCEVAPGIRAHGIVLVGSAEHADVRMSAQLIQSADAPILARICEGLRLPLSIVTGRELGAGVPNQTRVFDFIARYTGQAEIWLVPARFLNEEFESGLIRYHWVLPLRVRYRQIPDGGQLLARPEVFDQVHTIPDGGSAHIRVQLPPGYANDYSAEARRDFGPRIERLDADWVAYLSHSAVTVRGEQRPLMSGDNVARVIPFFSLSQVGSPEFWRATGDVEAVTAQMLCVAQHFLIDRRYLAPEEIGDLISCSLNEIQLPS